MAGAVSLHHGSSNTLATEICTFRFDHDPATLAPRGRACKSPAVKEIHWRDGRTSLACDAHGVEALTDDAKELVLFVAYLTAGQAK
jgi:hypothetical protein